MEKTVLTVQTKVNAPIEKVWLYWNLPEHITKWYFASDDWHAPRAENEVRIGGQLKIRMEAKDGSFGFDLEAVYTAAEQYRKLSFHFADGRKINVRFIDGNGSVKIIESFEAETQNPLEMQQAGWQAILNNFKRYAESL